MKSIALFLCTAALSCAADFGTGQSARALLGQQTFTAQDYGASATLLGGVSGIAYANGKLFVADSNRIGASPDNNRVVVFNTSDVPPIDVEFAPNSGRCPICIGTATLVLGQTDLTKSDKNAASASTLLQPTAVATDGTRLVVADTNFNRVLIWNTIPTGNAQPADLVLGQPDMTTTAQLGRDGNGIPISNEKSFRGPQGVWIQGNRLFVADTQNHRIMVWNNFPTQNNQAGDVVLGFPNFTTNKQGLIPDPSPSSLLNPVSVSSDGTRLFVSDLGNNRVLIWNDINTLANNKAADVVIGQPDFSSSLANNSSALCASNGTDSDNKPTYPDRCNKTMNFPRFVLSDGQRLFVADGGNDRVLIYNQVPTSNAAAADIILGQFDDQQDRISNSDLSTTAASDAFRTPASLAWDGTNLYVSDPFNRRVLVYTPALMKIPITGVRNAASLNVYALGSITLSGTIKAGDALTVTINTTDYKYTLVSADTFSTIVQNVVNLINAGSGDPKALALPNFTLNAIVLVAREGGIGGNSVTYKTTLNPTTSALVATTGGANLTGGQDAAKIGPYTLVTLLGDNLSDSTASADLTSDTLPYELGGVQVYFDGIRAPLLYVSPGSINAQIPVEVNDSDSATSWVRIVRKDGTVQVTSAIGVPIVPQNPGIFADQGTDPRPAMAIHTSSYASGTVQIDGSAKAGDVATIKIEDRSYSYTVNPGDTLGIIRDALIALINGNRDEKVIASAGGSFTRVRLRAKVEGQDGEGLVFSATASAGAQVVMTAISAALCCSNVAGAPVTSDNPAVPGETITVLATGLGLVKQDLARQAMITGQRYFGPPDSEPNAFVSSLVGGKTANIISAGLKPGTFGMYEIVLELNSDLPTNPFTQMTIAQDLFVSNIVTVPIFNPKAQ